MAGAWLGWPVAAGWWVARVALPSLLLTVHHHLDCLYILQLERYKPDRYARWMRGRWPMVVPQLEIWLQIGTAAAALVLPMAGIHWLAAYGLWLGAGHIAFTRRRPLQESQRLQWTARAVRVGMVALATGLLVAAVAWWLVAFLMTIPVARWLGGGIVGLALAGTFSPWIVLAAAEAMSPVERALADRFLGEAARRMRSYPGRVIGITGSYGKTTTKLIVADLLASRYRVLKTAAGINTTMGVTRVIREELRDEDEYFVVEVSAYGPGEIREVCGIVRPSLAILTAVGVQHLERFGTPEAIAEAKYELLASLPRGGTAVVNADDPTCLRLAERAVSDGKRVLRYGLDAVGPALALRGTDLVVSSRGTRFRVVTDAAETETFETRLLGRWNISNILAALTVGRECGVPLQAMREPVAKLSPAPRRLEIQEEGGMFRLVT